jgi:hypothetical protein
MRMRMRMRTSKPEGASYRYITAVISPTRPGSLLPEQL